MEMKADEEHVSVGIVFSPKILHASEKNPKFAGREKLVYGLIASYGLTKKLLTLVPRDASLKELQSYHSHDYLSFLQRHNSCVDHEDIDDDNSLDKFGLGYDCPVFEGMYDYCAAVCGASLTAASALVTGQYSVAVNWFGGWHHGRSSKAAGFCYCNDIVLAILKLLGHFKRVLYVDIDLHHGDGVEEAFSFSNKVMTVSFHKCVPGFFPGTGSVEDIGKGKGRFYSVNVPLKDGITDTQYTSLFKRIMDLVRGSFEPDVIVLQCGADGLHDDPMDSFSLTSRGLGECVVHVLSWTVPTLILGGGGYNFPSTAHFWTYVTSLLIREVLSNDIPDHEYLGDFGPEYSLHQENVGLHKRNNNVDEELEAICETIRANMLNIKEGSSQTKIPEEVDNLK